MATLLTLNKSTGQVFKGSHEIELDDIEYMLLNRIAAQGGEPANPQGLALVFPGNIDSRPDSATLDRYLRTLSEKINDAEHEYLRRTEDGWSLIQPELYLQPQMDANNATARSRTSPPVQKVEIPPYITIDDLVIDGDNERIIRGEDSIEATPQVFRFIQRLAATPGAIVSHKDIFQSLYGENSPYTNVEAQNIKAIAHRARVALGPDGQERIKNSRSAGYYYRSAEIEPPRDSIQLSDGIELIPQRRIVLVDGGIAPLTRNEYDIFTFIALNPGKTHNPEAIAEQVWGDAPLSKAEAMNNVKTYVKRIRAKIGDEDGTIIRNIRSRGYTFGDTQGETLSLGEVTIDLDRKLATYRGKEVPFTPTEYAFFEDLARFAGYTRSPGELWASSAGAEHPVTDREAAEMVKVYIRRIRRKIDDNGGRFIENVRGRGYRITIPGILPAPSIDIGALTVRPGQKQAYLNGDLIRLSASEYVLLETLASNPGESFTKKELEKRTGLASVYPAVLNLRRTLNDDDGSFIKRERGSYRIDPDFAPFTR